MLHIDRRRIADKFMGLKGLKALKELNKKQKLYAAGCAALIVLGTAVIFVPVRLTTDRGAVTLYDGNGIDEDSVSVSLTSIAGLKIKTDNYAIRDNGDGTALITSGVYRTSIPVRTVSVHSIVANVVGGAYEGVDVEKSDVEIKAVYTDGAVLPVPSGNVNSVTSEETADGTDTVNVHTDMGDTSVVVPVIEVENVNVNYGGKLYEHEKVTEQDIHVTLSYSDGAESVCSDYTFDATYDTSNAKITVHTQYGDASCDVPIINVSSVTASCGGQYYECDEIDRDEVTCTVAFCDGRKIENEPFTPLQDTIYALPNCDNIVHTAYGDTVLQADVVPITGVDIQIDTDDPYEDDVVHITGVTLSYEDGSAKSLSDKDIGDGEYVLRNGENTLSVEYHGETLSSVVNAKPNTNVRMALKDDSIQADISSAVKSYVDDTIIAYVNEYSTDKCHYYLTHVIINDPTQMCAGLSHDTYGGERETPTSASERMGWVVGINGSNFSYASGTPDPNMANIRIKQGVLMPDSGTVSNGMEICILPNGTLFSPPEGMTADDLLAMGVTDTYCCGDTLLVNHGNAVNVGIQSNQYRYPRTAIGMIRPCEYIIVTAGEGGYEMGMTYDEVRDVLMSNGCVFGKCMDGGGSSTLVFQNEMVNEPATNEERAVVDFLYWVK